MKEKEKMSSPIKFQNPIISSMKLVFSSWFYIILAAVTAATFWIVSSVFDQLLFFSPIVIFYLPDDAVLGFTVANFTAVLLGIVVSMNIYTLRHPN